MKNVMQIAMVCLLLVLFIDGMVWPPACIASDEADSPDAGPPAHPPIVRGFMSGHIREGHFRDMRAFGANVVRLQIDVVKEIQSIWWRSFWDAWPLALDRIESWVKDAIDAGLWVVVDLHKPPIPYVDFEQAELWNHPDLETNFCRVWRDIAERLLPYRDHIYGYDLYNEPLDRSQLPRGPREWPPMAEKIIEAIREVDTETWIIYEPGPGGLWTNFIGLEPLDDPKVIYSCHFYVPHTYTHQGVWAASLEEGLKQIGIDYPGSIDGKLYSRRLLESELWPVVYFQRKHNVPIFVGEFSVVRWAPKEGAVQWLTDVIDIFESHGWSWCYHAFREWHGWSLEHDETYALHDAGVSPTNVETERAKLIKAALQRNWE